MGGGVLTHLSNPHVLQAGSNVSAARVRGGAVGFAKVHVDPPVVPADVQVLVPDNLVVLLCVRAVHELPQRPPRRRPLCAKVGRVLSLQPRQSPCARAILVSVAASLGASDISLNTTKPCLKCNCHINKLCEKAPTY